MFTITTASRHAAAPQNVCAPHSHLESRTPAQSIAYRTQRTIPYNQAIVLVLRLKTTTAAHPIQKLTLHTEAQGFRRALRAIPD